MNVVEQLWDPASEPSGGDEAGPPALITTSGALTRAELRERSERWRADLAAAGIERGDRVVLIAGNGELFVVAYLALLGLGAVTVPLNPQSPPAELRREVDDVVPRAAIVEPAVLVAAGEAGAEALLGPSVPVIDVATLGSGEPMAARSVDPDDPAVLLFTSGTAGMPKPAVLTHLNLASAMASMVSLPVDLIGAGHVALAVIPLFHVFGLHTVINLGTRIGATLVIDDFLGADHVADLVDRHGVTLLVGPPAMWQVLAGADGLDAEAFASVKLAISGAAKLDPGLRARVAERLGLTLDEGYGLTETCAVAASSVGIEAPAGSVGHLMPGIEARLVDGDGRDVLVGDAGEVWARGPMVSPGYFTVEADGRARLVSNRDEDGWLRTGDVAVVDDGGFLSIVDRAKDLVIVSGFNVYPGEVEVVLQRHPAVAEAAVVGEADADTGEALVAHIVLAGAAAEAGEAPVDELLAHCRHQLARYKVPRRVEVHDVLPRGLAGKLRRLELR
ncbi:MAG: AMP-binding protein [Actinomycetota bacterium]